MGLAQMSALGGGRKYKQPYVEEINARKQYLPQVYAQKKEDKYRDKMAGLQSDQLALQEDALKQQKKAQKRANTLGYVNMGVGAGLGAIDAYPAMKEVGKDVVDFFSPAASEVAGGVTSPSSAQNFGGLASSALDMLGTPDVYKQFADTGFDVATGIYDNVVGSAIDVDWTEGFSDSDVIDFGW
jgi:hypothetical protein